MSEQQATTGEMTWLREQVARAKVAVHLAEAERDAVLARLGAIAALADKWADFQFSADISRHVVVARIREVLADSAGAIAKHQQEVRAEALREAAKDYWTDDSHQGTRYGAARDWLIARADALTEGGEPTAGEDGAAWFDHDEPMPAQEFESIGPVVVHEQGQVNS